MDPPPPDPEPSDPPESRGDPKSSPPSQGDPPVWGRPRRPPPARTRLRNRRFAAMKKLIEAGDYFSEAEMRWREPLLYQRYIGRYLEGDGHQIPSRDPSISSRSPSGSLGSFPWENDPPRSPRSLSGLLLRSVEEAALRWRLQEQLRGDPDSETEEEEGSPPPEPDAAERELLRAEFTSGMYQRFLEGLDGDFDYSQVDEDPELDDLELEDRDAEERYFDAEEPSEAPPPL